MDRRNVISSFSRRACSPILLAQRRAGSPAKRGAFTLIEVTISVALAVVLMLGISQVFRVSSETIGTGQALATVQRDARASQAVMARDFNTAVTDVAPYMLLDSQQIFAFQNQADLSGDKDGDPSTADLAGAGTESPQSAAIYTSRSHRIDALSFFARGDFQRQTGADVPQGGNSPFVSTMKGTEALLWYGHLNLANNSGAFGTTGAVSNNSPGAGTSTIGSSTAYSSVNPNNYFATNWILGRQQILLQERSYIDNNGSTLGSARVVDGTYPNGAEQYAYTSSSAASVTPSLSPLSYNSIAYPSHSPGTSPLTLLTQSGTPSATLISSRLDLAATSILGFRTILSSYISSNAAPSWWTLLPGGTNSLRFQAQPFFLTNTSVTTKVTPEQMAYQAPIFVRGCTQFIVEYAGDYLNQNMAAASITNANQGITDAYEHYNSATSTYSTGSTDGQIDFIYVVPTGGVPTNTQNLVKKIRWYGMPRSTTNNSTINAANGDVTPLRDVLKIAATATGTGNIPTVAPFEQSVPTSSTDYTSSTTLVPYICAWGPNDPKPKMIRITMTIDDPGGRLGDGQTYEYIYTLP